MDTPGLEPVGTPIGMGNWLGHLLSIGVWLAALAGFIPAIAALLALIWYMIQIWESDTCQKWVEERKLRINTRRLAELKAKQKVLSAELDALELVRGARAMAAEKIATAAHDAAKLVVKELAVVPKGGDG